MYSEWPGLRLYDPPPIETSPGAVFYREPKPRTIIAVLHQLHKIVFVERFSIQVFNTVRAGSFASGDYSTSRHLQVCSVEADAVRAATPTGANSAAPDNFYLACTHTIESCVHLYAVLGFALQGA
jgi:hypothetical protein